jgi:hypothetical protein
MGNFTFIQNTYRDVKETCLIGHVWVAITLGGTTAILPEDSRGIHESLQLNYFLPNPF